MNNWEPNPNWERLPKPEVGDIVQLKLSDAFEYLVKAIVTLVGENKITATIEAIFDWQSKDPPSYWAAAFCCLSSSVRKIRSCKSISAW